MSLRNTFLSRETLVGQGTPDEIAAKEAALLREKRIEHARAMRKWVEHRAEDFVRRPPAYLIDADSDEVFTVFLGAIFDPGTAYIAFNESIEMHWFVDHAGEIVFLQRTTPRTWSEFAERRAQRELAKARRLAPRSRRA